MAISFSCESCKKKIKAPDNTGGKWGKCPFCNHKCYIPLPTAEGQEELKLAPIDESEETQYGHMMRETHDITMNILHQKEAPEKAEGPSPRTSEKELTKNIIKYLRQMADGQLDAAQATAEKIVRYRDQAIEILDAIAVSEIPEPELQDVPQQVIAGFIKNIRQRMG